MPPCSTSCYLRASRDQAQILADKQDAAAVRVSAYTGLRLGELLALRWSDVDWSGCALNVSRAFSAGKETAPKSGKVRRVPLPDQALVALEQLSQREDFTQPSEMVFCNVATGRPLDGSALRRRFKAAQPIAGVHAMRWHDLRHTYGSLLAASGEELVTIKAAMGHANITTTEIYLHARPATALAARFTAAFRSRVPTVLPDPKPTQAYRTLKNAWTGVFGKAGDGEGPRQENTSATSTRLERRGRRSARRWPRDSASDG